MDKTQLHHYICLCTEHELDMKECKEWYKTAKKTLSSGILSSIQETDPGGNPDNIKMIHTSMKNGKHEYTIPLSRHLLNSELKELALNWQKEFDQSGWDFDYSVPGYNFQQQEDSIELNPDDYNDICTDIAKEQHNRWYQNLVDNGWRLGKKYSEKYKTHPKLMAWDQLPDAWKNADQEIPKIVINHLNKRGFKLIKSSRN